jgi:hypothetical protein
MATRGMGKLIEHSMKPYTNSTTRPVPVCAGSLGEAVHLVSSAPFLTFLDYYTKSS